MSSRSRYVKKWGVVIVFSIMAGLVGGLGAVLFRIAISFVHRIFFDWILPRVTYEVAGVNLGYALLPAFGALIVAIFVLRYPEIRGNGIPEVIEAVIFKGGNIPGSFAVVKTLATAVTIGSGGSVGREGPIGFIGAALTAILARWFNLSKEMKKLLVTCGLAAGIAGTFNTPLAGAMFALEVVYMGAFSINLVPIFVAAITGNALTLAVLKRAVEIDIPSGIGHSLPELPLFFILGLAMGLLAAAYARFLYAVIERFSRAGLPEISKPVLGGLGVGFVGMFFPTYGIFGIGYEGMRLAFYGRLTVGLLVTLALAKMLATALTLGSGHSGGVFAPSLYIGTMFGAAFGEIVRILFPSFTVSPAVYALAGMAAFFSGMTQAPLTQILMVTELTRSYAVLPPVMTSATIGFLTARFFLGGESIYTLKLRMKGYHVKTGKPVILETISVGEVMTTTPVYVHKDDTLLDVEHLISETGHDCFPVVDEDMRVVGVIGVRDLLKKPTSLKRMRVERFLNSRPFAVTYPTETAEDAFEKLMEFDMNLLPVVRSESDPTLVGVITKKDIYKAYYRGLEGMYIE